MTENAGGAKIRFSFGASSLLSRARSMAAKPTSSSPADTAWMDYLAQHKLIQPETRRDLLSNRLALIALRVQRLR